MREFEYLRCFGGLEGVGDLAVGVLRMLQYVRGLECQNQAHRLVACEVKHLLIGQCVLLMNTDWLKVGHVSPGSLLLIGEYSKHLKDLLALVMAYNYPESDLGTQILNPHLQIDCVWSW